MFALASIVAVAPTAMGQKPRIENMRDVRRVSAAAQVAHGNNQARNPFAAPGEIFQTLRTAQHANGDRLRTLKIQRSFPSKREIEIVTLLEKADGTSQVQMRILTEIDGNGLEIKRATDSAGAPIDGLVQEITFPDGRIRKDWGEHTSWEFAPASLFHPPGDSPENIARRIKSHDLPVNVASRIARITQSVNFVSRGPLKSKPVYLDLVHQGKSLRIQIWESETAERIAYRLAGHLHDMEWHERAQQRQR